MNKIGFYSVARIDDKNLSYRLDGFFFCELISRRRIPSFPEEEDKKRVRDLKHRIFMNGRAETQRNVDQKIKFIKRRFATNG